MSAKSPYKPKITSAWLRHTEVLRIFFEDHTFSP